MKQIVQRLGVARLWVMAVTLVAGGAALLWTGRDSAVFGQSIGGLLIVTGVALALLNLPSPDQARLIANAARAKRTVLDGQPDSDATGGQHAQP